MKYLSFVCAFLLLAPGLALAQTSPNQDDLESQIIHWVGPQTTALQNTSTNLYYAGQEQPIVMPFSRLNAGRCHLKNAALIIRKDGTGEFDATTYSDTVGAGDAWRTLISIFDGDGQLLFDTGDFEGPVMDGASRAKPLVWVNRFSIDHAAITRLYGRIDHGQISFGC